MENLNVAGMLKNRHRAPAIAAGGCGELRRHLQDTAAWYGCRVSGADQGFTSCTTCSGCGWADEDVTLTLADRTVIGRHPERPDGGLVRERDLNAAKNREQLADRSADRRNAGGEGSAGGGLWADVKLPSVTQEPDTRQGVSMFGQVLEDG